MKRNPETETHTLVLFFFCFLKLLLRTRSRPHPLIDLKVSNLMIAVVTTGSVQFLLVFLLSQWSPFSHIVIQ